MATEANCRPVITSFLITLFITLMLIILYLYHQLDHCYYDSNYVRKTFNIHYYFNTYDSYFNTNGSMNNF